MKRIPTFLAAGLLICATGWLPAQEVGGGRVEHYPRGADALPLLHEIWSYGAENIYPTTLAGRFNSTALSKLEDSLRSSPDVALADVLNPFLESLGVSHTRFYDRRHQSYYMLRSLFSARDLDSPSLFTIGVQLDDRDLGLVRAVLEGSPAAVSGIRRGDRVVAVDDVQFESLLQWQKGESTRLTIEANKVRRDISLTPIRQSIHRAMARATVESDSVFECTDRRIGYLHLWSGTNQVFLDALNNAVAGARDAGLDGFILDLRDGYGGAWIEYLDPFFSNRDEYFTATSHTSEGNPLAMHAAPQDNPDAWAGPLAVLINGGTRSGKESLAYQFRKSGRATLFGAVTNGAFTGGRGVFAERDVNYLLYLSVQETRLDGTIIEGVGVSPDVVLPDSSGSDEPLSAALNHLGCRIERP